jgi:hypothetical protein
VYRGVRETEKTQHCKGLIGPFNEKNLEPGYGYAKLIMKKEIYQTPV